LPFLRPGRVSSSKVPNVIDGNFWSIKILSTAMGEATSDFFVHKFSPVSVVLVGAVFFVLALLWQLGTVKYRTWPYWGTVVMVSIFGTMCADVVHVALHVPYGVSTTVFALGLLFVFGLWKRQEGTVSIHAIDTTRREVFYWLSVTTTFALGTALGDLTAYDFHWGFLRSGFMFTLIIATPALTYFVRKQWPVALFWTTYILTRPFGASYADYFGVSHQRGGLNFGTGKVSITLSLFILVLVAVAAKRESRAS